METSNEYVFKMKYELFNSTGFIIKMNTLCQFYTGNLCPEFKLEDVTCEDRQATRESFSRINVSNQLYSIQYEYYDYDTGSHYSSSPKMEFTLKKGDEKQIYIQKNSNIITVQTTSKHFENFCAYIKANLEPLL